MRMPSFAAAPSLPEGRRGTALALGLLAAALLIAWLSLGQPLLGWYRARAQTLAEERALAVHLQALAESLPALRTAARGARTALPPGALVAGNSDAVAAAALQGLIEELARRTDARLASIAILPAEPVGNWRRIGLRLSVDAPFGVLVHLWQALLRATPVMMVDDLSLVGSAIGVPGSPTTLDAEFTVYAFRRAAPPARSVVEQQASAE